MRNTKSQRRKPRFCTPGAPSPPSSFRRPTLQQFHHPYVVRVRRIVVVRNLVVLLGSLQDERDPIAARVLHEPFERLLANESVPYENVSILVGAELTSAVVQMKKRRSLAGGLLEFVEHGGESLLRFRDVVA